MAFKLILISVLLLFSGANIVFASEKILYVVDSKDSVAISEDSVSKQIHQTEKFSYRKSKRFTAALLCLALGPFGMHRLYLGSTPQVAAAYSVTLGGVGIVPAIDLLLITFSKDISRYKNNPRFIMWK